MYCGKCGAKNPEDASYCSACGAPLNKAAVPPTNDRESVPEKHLAGKRNRIIIIVAALASVLVLAIVLITVLGGGSYKSTIKKYIDATFEGDGTAVLALIPDEVVEAICDNYGLSREAVTEDYSSRLQLFIKGFDYEFEKWDYSFDILNVEDYSKKDLESLCEHYEAFYDLTIDAAKTVTIEFSIKANGEKKPANSFDMVVIKIGRSWYLEERSVPYL